MTKRPRLRTGRPSGAAFSAVSATVCMLLTARDMPTILRHALSLVALMSILLCAGLASAFELASGYPQRTNTKRLAPPQGLFDLSSSNAGINRADCLDVTQRWRFAFTDLPAGASHVEIWARPDATSCAPESERAGEAGAKSPSCFRVASFFAEQVVGKEVEIDNLSIIQAIEKKKNVDGPLDAKSVCSRTAHMKPTAIHLHVLAFGGSAVLEVADSTPAEIDYVTLYDLAGPTPPSGLTLGSGEGMLSVKFEAPTTPGDFEKYRVYCFRDPEGASTTADAGIEAGAEKDAGKDAGGAADAGDAAPKRPVCPTSHPFVPGALPTSTLDAYVCAESRTLAGEVVLDGRDNEVPYAVALAAIDRQGNHGMLSEVACETPRATDSFYDRYTAAGGRAGGGYCAIGDATAVSGPFVLGALTLAVLAAALRRRRVVGATLGAAVLLVAAPSLAADEQETPSIVTIEARFGPYRPEVDRGVDRGTPWKDTFGSAPRLMAGAEIDVTPIHLDSLGSIGFGALFGYTYATAKAEFSDGSGPSEEETSFDLWLLSALTTLRVDVVARKTRLPLVPYAKFGLMNGLWSSADGRGVSHGPGGLVARGRTNGFLYAVGAMLLLDVFDPDAAKTFAAERGVKHSYVFGELTVADLRGFGQTYAMRVGAVTWTAGVAFEL